MHFLRRWRISSGVLFLCCKAFLHEHFGTVFSGEAPVHPRGSGGTQEENGDRGAPEEEGGSPSSSPVHSRRVGAVRVRAGDLAPGALAVSSEGRAVKGPCFGVSLQGSGGSGRLCCQKWRGKVGLQVGEVKAQGRGPARSSCDRECSVFCCRNEILNWSSGMITFWIFRVRAA